MPRASVLLAALVIPAALAGCVSLRLAAYAPCDGRMAERIAGLPADSVTRTMRDSAKAEARNCAIQNALDMANLNEQMRLIQEQQVEDALRQRELERQLLNPPAGIPTAPQP